MKKYLSNIERLFPQVDKQVLSSKNFLDLWEEVSIEKNQFLIQPGQIEKYFYIVISGVQCLYLNTAKGNQKVVAFSYGGSFSGVYDSFLSENPSKFFLETLTDSHFIRINKEQYDSLFDSYPLDFNRWGRLAHQHLLIGRMKRELELITLTSKERFDVFMERCPKELLQIPQKYLASYINMTSETFSRMRAQIS